jgi:hypothetical protein
VLPLFHSWCAPCRSGRLVFLTTWVPPYAATTCCDVCCLFEGAAGVPDSPTRSWVGMGPSVYVAMCNVDRPPGDDLVDQGVGHRRRATTLRDACGRTAPTEQRKYQTTESRVPVQPSHHLEGCQVCGAGDDPPERDTRVSIGYRCTSTGCSRHHYPYTSSERYW